MLCCYIEYLTSFLSSPQTIRNYVSGVRTWHLRIAGHSAALDSPQVKDMFRAIDRTLRHVPDRKLPITQDILATLVHSTPVLGTLAPAMKVALLFGYYGFLRQSNIAPRAPHLFSPRQDTCRGDVLFAPPGLVLVLRWTKTLQRGDRAHMVPLPARPGHPLCPRAAYQQLLQHTPTISPNHPLLQVPAAASAPLARRCVTSSQLTAALKILLRSAGLPRSSYTLHSLRAGGATDAHRAGAQPLDIQRHGAWASDTFREYLAAPLLASAPIPRALASRQHESAPTHTSTGR